MVELTAKKGPITIWLRYLVPGSILAGTGARTGFEKMAGYPDNRNWMSSTTKFQNIRCVHRTRKVSKKEEQKKICDAKQRPETYTGRPVSSFSMLSPPVSANMLSKLSISIRRYADTFSVISASLYLNSTHAQQNQQTVTLPANRQSTCSSPNPHHWFPTWA